MIDFREVSWREFFWTTRPLLEAHADEYNIPNLDAYIGPHPVIENAEQLGRLIFVQAYDYAEDAVLGYIVWGTDRHPALGLAKVAKMGPWYVLPEHRRALADKLYKASLEVCRERECKYALATLPIRNRLRRRYFHRLFGRPYETNWLLEL